MKPTTEKALIAGGAALGIFGLVYLAFRPSTPSVDPKPPSISVEQDAEVRQNAAYLLQYEGDPAVLRALAPKLTKAGYPILADQLLARAKALGG